MFGTVVVSVAFVAEVEPVMVADVFEWYRTVDERHAAKEAVFFTDIDNTA